MYETPRQIYGIYIREVDINSGEISDYTDRSCFTTLDAARHSLEVEANREIGYGNDAVIGNDWLRVTKRDGYSHAIKRIEYRIVGFSLYGKFSNERR